MTGVPPSLTAAAASIDSGPRRSGPSAQPSAPASPEDRSRNRWITSGSSAICTEASPRAANEPSSRRPVVSVVTSVPGPKPSGPAASRSRPVSARGPARTNGPSSPTTNSIPPPARRLRSARAATSRAGCRTWRRRRPARRAGSRDRDRPPGPGPRASNRAGMRRMRRGSHLSPRGRRAGCLTRPSGTGTTVSMDILTLNCGSSSLKYQLYRWDDRDVLARGIVERVGVGGSFINHYSKRTGAKREDRPRLPHPHGRHPADRGHAAAQGSRRHQGPVRDRGGRTPRGPRRGPVREVRAHRRRRAEDVPGPLGPRAAAQPPEHHGHRGGAQGAARPAALRGHGHGLAPDHAGEGVPLRAAPRVVREVPRAALRLPRHLVPVRGEARRRAARQGPLPHQPRDASTSATGSAPTRSRTACRSTPPWASRRSKGW